MELKIPLIIVSGKKLYEDEFGEMREFSEDMEVSADLIRKYGEEDD